MYGSLTTIILIMLWLYFCMYIVCCSEDEVICTMTRRLLPEQKKEVSGDESRGTEGLG